jgi:ATP-binding protein involved in chromosome partitioning
LGLVENMSGFSCPHCGEAIDMFGTGGGERTASTMGIRFLGKIPFDQKLVACGDSGTCFQDLYKDNPVSKAYSEITDKMVQLLKI